MQPYKHQIEIINFMLQNKRAYNFSDLGSGKTSASIWACDMLLEANKIKKVLIVCPLSIMRAVWAEEIEKVVPNRSYSIVHGSRIKRLKALEKRAHFYIINSDGVGSYYNELLHSKFDVVIIDEVDSFKNPTSQRSKRMQLIAKNVMACYGLTCTPMGNSPEEAFGIGRVINPDNLPTRYITKWRSMTMIQVGPYAFMPSADAQDIVYKALQPAVRFKLSDCVDIPDIIFEYREFQMTKEQAKLYKEIFLHQVADYEGGIIKAPTAGVKFTKLLQIAGGAVYDSDGNTIALPVKDKIQEVLHVQKEAGQVIVFCQFIELIKQLERAIPEAKSIYGKTNQSARADIISAFRAGKFNILIAQPRVMAHGVNLQFCHTIIFYGPILGNNFYRQAIGRIRRSGQKYKQTIINFFSSSIEKKLYKTLETKNVSSESLLKMYEDNTNEH